MNHQGKTPEQITKLTFSSLNSTELVVKKLWSQTMSR